jgi:uncharacterized protein (TIGR03083 family)
MQRPTRGSTQYAEGLTEQTVAFVRAVEGAEPDARVPTCPQWQVRDLVGHIGQGHRWAAEIVRTGRPSAVPDPRDARPGSPSEWSAWLTAGAAELVDAVREIGDSTVVWTIVGQRPADFWLRRMRNDTTVHVADAAFVSGTAYSIPDDLAADAIDEGLELLSSPDTVAFKPGLAELRGHGETLAFRSATLSWLVTRTQRGVTWDRVAADADVVVTGTMRDLLMVLTQRVKPGDPRIAVTGDRALLDHWLARTTF